MDIDNICNYIVTKPGDFALLRESSKIIPDFAQIAEINDYMANNLATFPWGFEPQQPTNWDYQGINGLFHHK
ncbi:MAG: hypothetical protein HC932_05005 [Thermales bacterium]|nr:hypothetical protein [Thermales bacterium]